MSMRGYARLNELPEEKVGEQIFWVLSGKMEFTLGGDKRTCVAGDLRLIPGDTPREAYFVEDTEVIDIFAPPREDMFTGGDTYLAR